MTKQIEFKRVNNDVNGNPRYVCHFFNLLTDDESRTLPNITAKYNAAIKTAHKIGGKKYRGKDYGGGIVFQSYNIGDTEKAILRLTDEG